MSHNTKKLDLRDLLAGLGVVNRLYSSLDDPLDFLSIYLLNVNDVDVDVGGHHDDDADDDDEEEPNCCSCCCCNMILIFSFHCSANSRFGRPT